MPAVISLEQVEKRYGAVEALKGVDFEVDAGELVALLGPNGAGKTTAISILLGLRHPTRGKVSLFGLAPSTREARSRVGVMLQESGVPTVLKVRELVDLFRSYYPRPLTTAEAIELAGLEEKADARVSTLSGGQQQRLYFALAIAGDPDVLFLDEPTVGLDVEGRRRFLDSIRRFHQGGKTVLLTTHYLEEADELAQRIVVIDRGRVIADASPREIKSRVAGRRVSFTSAQFAEPVLDGLPVTAVDRREGRTVVLTNSAEDVVRRLLDRVSDLADLEVVGADLEEAFVALTEHAGAPA
ncbi:MAG TPA: ABC transporter ATP-binding protein [Candidatus Dormibacteraeota bacterium]